MRAPWMLLSLAALHACASASTPPDAAAEWDVPLGGDGGGVDIPVAPIDIVRVDAPGADITPGTDAIIAGDAGAAVRSCRTVFTYNLGRSARAVAVAGEWNQFSPTTNPMTDTNGAGSYRLELELPPGDYGYKFVVDGTQWGLDPGRIARKYVGSVENSRVVVTDCNTPELRVLRQRATADGMVELDIQYVAGGDRSDADPAARRVVMNGAELPAGALTWDAATRVMRVRLTGLARDRYTFRVNARSMSGRSAEELIVPMWVEETPYQWGDGSLYFVFTDRFRNGNPLNDGRTGGTAVIADWHGGDFAGVTAAINEGYFDQMGVRALWLSPVNSNTHNLGRGADNRQYTGYHGYWVNRAREADSHWGTLDELRALNRAAHRRGIRVLYDLVNNQLHREHPYFMERSREGWFNGDGTCTCGGPSCGWDERRLDCWFTSYLPDVNWTNMSMADQMVSDAWWWLVETDADGFRVDAAKHMDFLATTNLRDRLNRWENGNAAMYTVGETFAGNNDGDRQLIRRYIGDNALHAQFDFPVYWAILEAFARSGGGMMDLENTVRANESVYGQFPMSPFLGNHDVTRFLSEAAGQIVGNPQDLGYNNPPGPPSDDVPYARLRLAWTFTLTQRGVPLIYYGDEIGLPGAADPDNRRPMRFGGDVNAREQTVLAHVRALGQLRARHVGLQRGARTFLHADGDGYVYARGAGMDLAVVALNRGTTARAVSVAVPGALGAPDGTVLRDALSTATVTVRDGRVEVPFTARGSSVFVR
jgi:glycosidase